MNEALKNFIYFVVIVVLGIVIYLEGPKLFFTQEPKWTLYYSVTCPHCKKVEDFIEANQLFKRFTILKKEVTVSHPASIQELAVRARHCGIKDTTLTVPFLWTGKECLSGDKVIIDFFNKQMKKTI